MRTIWQSLAWKEWHEHKWKLASIVAILGGVSAVALGSEQRERLSLAGGMVLLCIVPLAVFVGLSVAANERSRGTLRFLQALPVPMWRAALTKFVAGLLTLGIAIAFAIVGLIIAARLMDVLGVGYRVGAESSPFSATGNWYLDRFLFCAAVAASLYIWTTAAGVNRKDEVSAGAVALAIMVGWSSLVVFLSSQLEYLGDAAAWLRVILLSTAPGGVFAEFELHTDRRYLPFYFATITVIHCALIAFYIRRYGRVANLELRSPQAAARDASRREWLGPPRLSAFTAIVWKQFRESGPLTLIGLSAAVAIGVTYAVFDFTTPFSGGFQTTGQVLVLGTFMASLYFSSLTALVVGIGVFLNDLTPAVNTFWRSRPIPTDLWFCTKFVSGLLIVVLAFQLPFIAIYATATDDMTPAFRDMTTVLEMQGVALLVTVAVFAAAAAMTCLVRHAIYAAILSIAVLYLTWLAGSFAWSVAGMLGWIERTRYWWQPDSTGQVVTGLITGFLTCTLIAWLAVRYDWGRKSRY